MCSQPTVQFAFSVLN